MEKRQMFSAFATVNSILYPLVLVPFICNSLKRFEFDSSQMDELGRLLVNVCTAVPKGVVCFLPSYDYEKTLVAHWTRTGALCRLQGKKVDSQW